MHKVGKKRTKITEKQNINNLDGRLKRNISIITLNVNCLNAPLKIVIAKTGLKNGT